MRPNEQAGALTPRDLSASSQKARQKGLSLSKELKPKRRNDSPSFIKLVQKGKKPLVVEKREIKLIIKGKNDNPTLQDHNNKENRNYMTNTGTWTSREYMDAISSHHPCMLHSDQSVNENFPLKRSSRN